MVAAEEQIRTAALENGAAAWLSWRIVPSWPWRMAENIP